MHATSKSESAQEDIQMDITFSATPTWKNDTYISMTPWRELETGDSAEDYTFDVDSGKEIEIEYVIKSVSSNSVLGDEEIEGIFTMKIKDDKSIILSLEEERSDFFIVHILLMYCAWGVLTLV